MRLSRRSIMAFTLALASLLPLDGHAEEPVDLELVLAVDVSGSVDPEEATLQRDGYVQAFLNEKVQRAIRGGPFGRIAVVYVEWAGDNHQHTVIDWTLLSDAASVRSFALAVAEAPITSSQWTSISGAIDYAVPLFDGNGVEGTRRVIDVSGDGENNRGRPVELARDAAVARGITINGLPILNDRPNPWGGSPSTNLDGYYRDHVIGGPGAFLVPAMDFGAFADAILNKLLLEVSGTMPDRDWAAWDRERREIKQSDQRRDQRRPDGFGPAAGAGIADCAGDPLQGGWIPVRPVHGPCFLCSNVNGPSGLPCHAEARMEREEAGDDGLHTRSGAASASLRRSEGGDGLRVAAPVGG